MRFFLVLIPILFLFFLVQTFAQEVQVQPVAGTQSAGIITFPGPEANTPWMIKREGQTLTVTEPEIELSGVLSFDLSPDGRHLAALIQEETTRIEIFNIHGYKVAQYSDLDDINPGDPSLKLFITENGAIAIRDNITSVTLLNLTDLLVDRVSYSSGSERGETMMRVVSSADGRYSYVYNPRIITESGFASRIGRLDPNGEVHTVFYDEEREIVHAEVSENGEEIFAVFSNEKGTMVRIINIDAEVTAELDSPLDNPGFFLQPEFNAITWFSGNSARAFDIVTGESLAHASLSHTLNIIYAMYDPDDNLIVTLTGSMNNQSHLMQIDGVRVIDLTARSILHSRDLGINATFTEDIVPAIIKTNANQYRLTGVTGAVDISVRR